MSFDTPLAELLAQQIQDGGPIPFRDFMEMVLYHPEYGYYNRARANLGKEGDFYTSPQVGPVFGWTLARAIEKLFFEESAPQNLQRPKHRKAEPFSIVEFGAGKGFLAWDVLECFKHLHSPLLERVQYIVVEQSPPLRRFQERLFSRDPEIQKRVRWCPSDQLQSFTGVVLANEFVDALPFHRVALTKRGFEEVFVAVEENNFVERLFPLSSPRLKGLADEVVTEYERSRGCSWPLGHQMEIGVDVLDWLASLAQQMQQGQVILIDYGDEVAKLFADPRPRGTVKAFFRHQLTDRLYDHIGQQDLTAAVNFSSLLNAARSCGFSLSAFMTQSDFLQRHDILKVAEERERVLNLSADEARATRRQILNLILPEMMGTRFKVLHLTRTA
jgi:SAM-dependent MidA family methyltransferase